MRTVSGSPLLCLLISLSLATRKSQQEQSNFLQDVIEGMKQGLIYVSPAPSASLVDLLEELQDKIGTFGVIDADSEHYDSLTAFVGMPLNANYLVILDPATHTKYVLEVTKDLSGNEVVAFHQQFVAKALKPYYNSEAEPNQPLNTTFWKVVGKTLRMFVEQPVRFRILYLFADVEVCDVCLPIWKTLEKLARSLVASKHIVFGYYDVFHNQHENLTEEDLPQLLLFADLEAPFAYEKYHADEIGRLLSRVERMVKETAVPVQGTVGVNDTASDNFEQKDAHASPSAPGTPSRNHSHNEHPTGQESLAGS